MKKVIIIGAGGHGQVVADILIKSHESGSQIKPIGYLDDDSNLQGSIYNGLPVFGGISTISDIPHDAIIIALGNNRTRSEMFHYFQEKKEKFINAIHPKSILSNDIKTGVGIMICAGVIINSGSVIGSNVIINTGSTIDHHNTINNHTHIAPGVNTGGEVTVGEGALIGIGATVVPMISIGAWSVVGAGSVVCRNLPDSIKAIGIPAKIISATKT